MPSAAKHSEQEQRNDDVYRNVIRRDNPAYSEWAMTAIFYRAVHTIDCFLASGTHAFHPVGHPDRRKALERLGKQLAAAKYWQLKGASQRARYGCERFTDAELDSYEELALVELPAALT